MFFVAAGTAHANLLVNGSFEEGPSPGACTNRNGGDTSITGWTVTGSTIDCVGSYWQASDGSRSLDLDGSRAPPYTTGGVAQTFATTPGTAYRVSFDMSGNPENLPAIKPMRVSAAGQQADFFFDVTGHSAGDMGWVELHWDFVADATTATLEFRSLNLLPFSGWGPALDNVSVAALPAPVPEPTSWALFAAGGAALLAWSRRRL